jgi:hypothetical protein
MRDFIRAILFRLTLLAWAAGLGVGICAIGLGCCVACLGGAPWLTRLVWVSVVLFAGSVVFRLLADRI